MNNRAMTSPFLSYRIEGRLFLGFASSNILGRSSESLTMYHATPALSAPVASRTTSRTDIIINLRIDKPFFLRGLSFRCWGWLGFGAVILGLRGGWWFAVNLCLCRCCSRSPNNTSYSSGSMRKFLPGLFCGRRKSFSFIYNTYPFFHVIASNNITTT